ncbi:MAG: hypothetical protein JSU68_05355, partial [Phycisphaerales bacterium]
MCITRFMPVLGVLLESLCVSPLAVLGAPGDVAGEIAAPCKYPSGLASDGTHLFVADWRDAKIYQVDPATGAVVRQFDAPTLKPHGLACADGRLFVSDDHTGGIYTLNLQTGVVDNYFEAPDRSATGLAYHDG